MVDLRRDGSGRQCRRFRLQQPVCQNAAADQERQQQDQRKSAQPAIGLSQACQLLFGSRWPLAGRCFLGCGLLGIAGKLDRCAGLDRIVIHAVQAAFTKDLITLGFLTAFQTVHRAHLLIIVPIIVQQFSSFVKRSAEIFIRNLPYLTSDNKYNKSVMLWLAANDKNPGFPPGPCHIHTHF